MKYFHFATIIFVLFSFTLCSKLSAQSDEKIILTPKPGPEPKINGATVFGVRPGSPFLFTIPATGERPMEFVIEDLPEGLVLNNTNGMITGKLSGKGKYQLKITATNKYGKCERDFRIICGDTLALTPHMGWNSWYVWENHVTDKIIRDAAEAMVKTNMINHGYMYVNIDDCWAVKPGSFDSTLLGSPRNQEGKINSNPRFPDMKSLTDYIHSLGLKAGIYSSPGPLTCAGHTGSYLHEKLDMERFAEWGFDFLKYDWCSYGELARDKNNLDELKKPYLLVSSLLKAQKRDIVLNLCQYGMGNVWEWGASVGGNSWRTADDLGGSFEGIGTALFRDGFDLYSKYSLQNYSGPGEWNDPDYLLLGYLSNWKGQTVLTPLTPNEQYSHVSLWCLLAAPLIFSGDITRMDAFTLNLLTNDEVIELDQDPLGKSALRVSQENGIEVWVKDLEDGSKAVGLFNRTGMQKSASCKWGDLKINGKQKARDLWRQKDIGILENQFSAVIPSHGVVLIRLWPATH